ncbi:MAG: sel1 repeat family protein [Candidatus Arsenophonus phytopathogenicus]
MAALFKKAEIENDEYSNYTLFSLFSIGCFDLRNSNHTPSAKEECRLANFFLKRALEINPNNGLTLYFTGSNYRAGSGVKQDMSKAVYYYEKAYSVGGNKIIAAGSSLVIIYLYGINGFPQDFKKTKYYLEMIAKDNPKGKNQYYLRNFDSLVFLAKDSKKIDECKQKDKDSYVWVKNV